MATSDHNMTSSENSKISSEPTLKKQTVRVADLIQADKDRESELKDKANNDKMYCICIGNVLYCCLQTKVIV